VRDALAAIQLREAFLDACEEYQVLNRVFRRIDRAPRELPQPCDPE
jgi:hypothetical protein